MTTPRVAVTLGGPLDGLGLARGVEPAAAAALALRRLSPDRPADWAWWPVFERRAVEACAAIATDTPPEGLRALLRQRWATAPETLGAWLGLRGETAIGHALAFVDVAWGRPQLLVHQVVADPGVTVTGLADPWLADLADWWHRLDAAYAAAGSPLRIARIVMVTAQPAAWARYLAARGVGTLRTLTTVELDLTGSR